METKIYYSVTYITTQVKLSNHPLVSLVVRTKNEEERIVRCLQGCAQQTYKSLELIVIDNNSDDSTKLRALEFTDLVFDHGPERVAQGNYGMIRVATGEIVAYLDADMILEPNLVESAVEHMTRTGDVGLYINETVLGKGYWGNLRRFERSFYNGTCIDAARFLNREAVCKENGFDEKCFPTPSAEDWDLDRRINYHGNISQLVYKPASLDLWNQSLLDYVSSLLPKLDNRYHGLFHDESRISPIVYAKKKTYYSGSMDNYIGKWGKSDLIVRKQFGFKYRLFTVFIEDRKWLRLIRHPLLSIGMLGYRIYIGCLYITRFK
jgi:glycosyltransferase involved in cell wall biosynthesis